MLVPRQTKKEVFSVSSNFCNLFLLNIYSGIEREKHAWNKNWEFVLILEQFNLLVNRGVKFNNLTFINKEFILSKEMNTEPFGSDIGSILRNFLVVAVTLERFVKKEFSGHDHRERGFFMQ